MEVKESVEFIKNSLIINDKLPENESTTNKVNEVISLLQQLITDPIEQKYSPRTKLIDKILELEEIRNLYKEEEHYYRIERFMDCCIELFKEILIKEGEK